MCYHTFAVVIVVRNINRKNELIKAMYIVKNESKLLIFFFLFNDCQPKTIGFRVSTSNLGRLHG